MRVETAAGPSEVGKRPGPPCSSLRPITSRLPWLPYSLLPPPTLDSCRISASWSRSRLEGGDGNDAAGDYDEEKACRIFSSFHYDDKYKVYMILRIMTLYRVSQKPGNGCNKDIMQTLPVL